jgi:hypothetical protein
MKVNERSSYTDLDRDDVSALGFGGSVVLLDELHDVDAVLTERRSDRGCRGSGTCGDLQLDNGCELLLGRHGGGNLFLARTTEKT